MDWERKKFLIELKMEKIKLQRDRFVTWVKFLQVITLVLGSATIGLVFKLVTMDQDNYSRHFDNLILLLKVAGAVLLLLVIELYLNYRKIKKSEAEIKNLKSLLEEQ